MIKDGVAIAASGDVVMTVWTVPVTPALWVWHVRALERAIAANPNGIISMGVVHGPHKLPSASVVGLMQEDYRRIGDDVRRLVIAPLGDSMWTSVARALVRTMAVISGASQRLQLADSIVDALQMTCQAASSATPTGSQLRQMADEAHRALGLDHHRGTIHTPL